MLKAMTPHSIPIFFCNAGIGVNRGVFSPQIRDFDVYYKSPIIVGFHVVGSTVPCPDEVSFSVEHYEEGPQVAGFFAMYTAPIIEPEIQLSVEETEDHPQVVGFYAFAPSQEHLEVPTVEITDLEAQGPAIDSFHVEGISDN